MAAIMNQNRAKHARAINPVDLMPLHLIRPGDRRQRGMSGDQLVGMRKHFKKKGE